MNMKYKVSVTRISYASKEFEVEAENEIEAKNNALDKAYNTVFSEDSADYESEIIAKW
jgi:hypothetical protein